MNRSLVPFFTWTVTGAILSLLAGLISGCAVLPENMERPVSSAVEDTGDTHLARILAKENSGSNEGMSAFHLLDNGMDAFVARAELAGIAEKSIDLQYYMIRSDHVGTLLMNQLLEAADRGVRVRILLDDINEGYRDSKIAVFNMHPNIEVRIFNPFGRNVRRFWQYITGFGRQTRRAHNKSYTVDNLATILGGRNIGDEYFERDPQLAFQDLDILALGPVAREVSASFDRYWNHKLSYPIGSLLENRPTPEDYLHVRRMHEQRAEELMDSVYLERLRNSELARQLSSGQIRFTWAKGEVFADDPNKLLQATDVSKSWMIQDLVPYLESARKELILISPYFVPGKKGVAFFRKLIDRGVKVRILTNSLASTDVTVVHAGYARYRRTLLRMGVELWELNKITSDEERKAMREGYLGKPKSSLHAKAFVVDGKTLFIGSMNFDPRSVIQNTEIGVVIETPVLARKVAETFDRRVVEEAFRVELLSDAVSGQEKLLWHGRMGGRRVTLETEPYSGIWRRLGILLMMWLPMVSQI